MSIAETFFNHNPLTRDMFDLVVGQKLGTGAHRTVYRCFLDDSSVFKFESVAGSFANIVEWESWQTVRYTKYASWFAPVKAISSCGTIILQKFVRDAMEEEYPDSIPAFFTDIKKSNFGILDGKFVCRDYGCNLLMTKGITSKMQKVNWNE